MLSIHWDEVREYLEKVPLSSNSVSNYLNRLRRILEQEQIDNIDRMGLIYLVDELLKGFSKEGRFYDPKDHGNNVAALRHLKNYLYVPYSECLWITYNEGYQSFPDTSRHVGAYRISDRQIEITYYRGQVPVEKVVKPIKDKQWTALLDIVLLNRSVLSPSDTAFCDFHGPKSYYEYELDDHTAGVHCRALFDNDTMARKTDYANELFVKWLTTYL